MRINLSSLRKNNGNSKFAAKDGEIVLSQRKHLGVHSVKYVN